MIANALFAATVCLLAALIYALEVCTFLVPYRDLIFSKYFAAIVTFAGLLLINTLCLVLPSDPHRVP
jgi:hypothetical protein